MHFHRHACRNGGRDPRHAWFEEREDVRFGGRHGFFGGPWRGFFGEDDGPGSSGRRGGGRVFGPGDLKLLLLGLIEQQPRHGYELIRIIEEMFHGQYTPSPGAIYPTLTMLEEMGHAQAQAESGGRKLYAITDAGRAWLEENRDAVEAATERVERSARMAARMAPPQAVRKAMRALRHALLMRGADGLDGAEATRIAAILERAAAEIAGRDARRR